MQKKKGGFEPEKGFQFFIHPQNRIKLMWDLCVNFLLFSSMWLTTFTYQTFFYRFRIALRLAPLDSTSGFEKVIDILLILDIFLTFLTGYYYEKKVVSNMGKIAMRYLKNQLVIDCISNIPMIATKYEIEYLYFLKMLRILKMNKFFDNIGRILQEATVKFQKQT